MVLSSILSKIIGVLKSPFRPIDFPLGVKVILWYTGALALFQFIVGLVVPSIYPKILESNPMIMLFNVVFLFVSWSIIYGILNRKYWAYQLMIIWYVVAIIYNFMYFFYSFDFFDVMSQILLIGLVFSFIVNCVVIWYLFSQKEYFKHRGVFLLHKRIKLATIEANDHVFMVVFVSVWFVTVLVLILSGVKLVNDTFVMTNQVISDVKQTGFYDISSCQHKGQQYEDVCYMTYGITTREKTYCDMVSSAFYKFTCYMGV